MVDPWVINDVNSDRTSWLSNYSWYHKFLSERLPTNLHSLLFELEDFRKKWSNDYTELLSFSVLKISLRSFLGHEDKNKTWAFFQESLLPADRSAWRKDGSRIYPTAEADLNSQGAGDEQASVLRYATEIQRWGLSPRELMLLTSLLKDMSDSRVSVAIIAPPFRQDIFKIVEQYSTYPVFQREFFGYLEGLKADRLVSEVCNIFDPKSFGCDQNQDFMDNVHMRKPCVLKALQHCFKDSENWGALLRPPLN
jgi:hypothetical protein